MSTLKTIFRQTKTLLWTAFSILVITAAVLVGLGKLLMPYSDRYQPRLEAWLSAEFGRPIEIESFQGEWTAFGPRLSLRGLKLMAAQDGLPDGVDPLEEEVALASAALDLKPLNMLIPGRPLYNFRVIGADLELRHTLDGRFELSGFGVSGRGGEEQGSALRELARVGEVILQDSNLIYQDEKLGILLGFTDIQGGLRLDGNNLSTEIQAKFHDSRSGLVYGDIEATLLMTIDNDQRMVDFAWQAKARELMLAAFQGRLPRNPFLPMTGWLNAELWGEWSRQEGHSVKGINDLREARLVNEYQDLRLDRVNYRFNWRFANRGKWDLHMADFLYDDGVRSWTAPRVTALRDIDAGVGLWISADELPLDAPLSFARDVMSIYETPWPASLPRAASGVVSDLDLILGADWRLEWAEGKVAQAAVSEWGRWPALSGLDADVSLRRGSGIVLLNGEQVMAEWPRMFRNPLNFAMPACALDIRWGQGWQLGFSDCQLENDDLAVQGNVRISSDEGKPDVDINVALTRGNIERLGPYWPEEILKDSIKSWLRQGLKSGDLVSGRFQVFGDMDDWPFRDGAGRFDARAEIANGQLQYMEGWPDARQLTASVRFANASMDLEGSIGDIGGLGADSISARIPDLKSAVLTVDYKADSDLPGVLRFLEETPLKEQIGVDLSRFEFAGNVHTEATMVVPIASSSDRLSLEGSMELPDGFFSDPGADITLENISGVLHYNEQGFSGTSLETQFRGYPGKLDLAAGTEGDEKFRADLEGVFGVRDVIPAFLLDSYAELAKVDGQCFWTVSMTVEPDSETGENEALLRVESGLAGVALNLPAPLFKPAGERWPLVLHYPLSGPEQLLDVEFTDRVMLRFDLSGNADSPHRAVIRLGEGLPSLPPKGLIRIEGGSETFDLDGWIDVIIDGALGGQGMGGLELEQGSVEADRLLFLDRYFDDVAMQFDVVDNDIRGVFKAEDIDGKIRFTTGEQGMSSLSAEFERLALADPVKSGVEMETDPADLPAVHLYVKSFRYLGVELGETRIEAYPTASGFHFEKVDASAEHLTVNASGDWSLSEGGQRSDFEIHMSSESLGDFLSTMDISSSMQGGQTVVDFSAWWPGSPAAFALSRLNGLIEFSVVDGNITDASAGGGRLLGLLSIQALPKRLSLDFRDVFDAGYSFDQATGTFTMENGMASTDDMLLKSSAASISISGSTSIVDQQYDQLLTIRPGLGNTLPIIGVLAGGPVGVAAGLALQGLLHEQIGEATKVQYTITGDWDDPVFEAVEVERIEKEPEPNEDN
ncbi:YhdP family protein [Pseudomonadota bacterium]